MFDVNTKIDTETGNLRTELVRFVGLVSVFFGFNDQKYCSAVTDIEYFVLCTGIFGKNRTGRHIDFSLVALLVGNQKATARDGVSRMGSVCMCFVPDARRETASQDTECLIFVNQDAYGFTFPSGLERIGQCRRGIASNK